MLLHRTEGYCVNLHSQRNQRFAVLRLYHLQFHFLSVKRKASDSGNRPRLLGFPRLRDYAEGCWERGAGGHGRERAQQWRIKFEQSMENEAETGIM